MAANGAMTANLAGAKRATRLTNESGTNDKLPDESIAARQHEDADKSVTLAPRARRREGNEPPLGSSESLEPWWWWPFRDSLWFPTSWCPPVLFVADPGRPADAVFVCLSLPRRAKEWKSTFHLNILSRFRES